MKFDPKDLLSTTGIAGAGLGGDWLAKVNEIIAGINKLIQQYGELRQNMPGITTLRPPHAAEINQPAEDPTAKMLLAARMFLSNLQKQGMGDHPVGQVISKIPETVDQLAAGLDQLIARASTTKGIKGA